MNIPDIMDSARRGLFLVLLMLFMVLAPLANAADSDGDGIDDSVDDCRFAAGTSTLDRNGCPDADGDGTSDINDGWSAGNPNFQNEYTTSSNSEYNDIEYSPDGEFIVTASDDGFVRKWNASSHVNVKSVLGSPGNDDITSVAYSPDGMYVAAGLDDDDDSVHIYYANNLTSVYGAISANVGSGDLINDVEFSPDSDLLAVSIGRSGDSGTNGRVLFVDVSDGSVLSQFLNPNNEDRFYDSEFSPDGELIVLAGNGDFYISNVSSGATVYTITSPPESVNAIAWSPDGTSLAISAPPAGIDITAGKGFPSADSNPEVYGPAEGWEDSLTAIMKSVDTCRSNGSAFTEADLAWWRDFETHERESLQGGYTSRRMPERPGWAALKAGGEAAAAIHTANLAAAAEQVNFTNTIKNIGNADVYSTPSRGSKCKCVCAQYAGLPSQLTLGPAGESRVL